MRTEAVIILSRRQTQAGAAHACAALSETLLDAGGTDDYQSILNYLGHLDQATADDKYWVLGHAPSQDCLAMSQRGEVTVEDCSQSFAALCSHQAPLSTSASADRSRRWQMTVPLDGATLYGYRDKRSFKFEGIRYAPQPQRFAHSTLQEVGSEEIHAVDPGSWCIQSDSQGSEDCLFLNVWTPYIPLDATDASAKLRPVMLYIHGGAFVSGSGAQSAFDGGNMASRGDVVVVTINYRLGTMGFLSLANLGANGNWALGDQLVALQWVRKYIRWLGGDPDRITLVGQSAGAASVRVMLGLPQASGQFAGAILQSSPAGFGFSQPYSDYTDLVTAYFNHTVPVLEGVGCLEVTDQLACMRKVDAHTLGNLNVQAAAFVQDGWLISFPRLPLEPSSSVAQVPILMGTMMDESPVFLPLPFTWDASLAFNSFGLDPTLLQGDPPNFPLLPGEPVASAYNVLARAASDAMFRCLDYATADALSLRPGDDSFSHSRSTYYYEMNRAYGFYPNLPHCMAPPSLDPDLPWGDPGSPNYYKCHSGDLLYTWGNIGYHGLPARDDFDVPFSQYLVDMWAQFARNGDPNPHSDWLAARGYTNTTLAAAVDGPWPPVGIATAPAEDWGYSGSPHMMRVLAAHGYTSADVPFSESEQCKMLGYPLNYYSA